MLIILLLFTCINLALLLLTYKWVRISVQVGQDNHAYLTEMISDVLALRENVAEPDGIDLLGREWYGREWPRQLSQREREILLGAYTQDGLPRFPNPVPFEVGDSYSSYLLTSKFATLQASDKIRLLQQLRSVSQLPLKLAELAATDSNETVRIWLASHAKFDSLEKGDAEGIINALKNDPSPYVIASLLSNPDFEELPWQCLCGGKLEDDWRERVRRYTPEQCLALMYNPMLSPDFLLELMRSTPATLSLDPELHKQMVAIGVRNPGIIENSRMWGRKMKQTVSRDDVIETDMRYGEIWKLAFGGSWLYDISRPVARYIQTSPKVKLEIYNRFRENRDPFTRLAILEGCIMPMDEETLRLGAQDSEMLCKREAQSKIEAWEKRRFPYQPDIH